MNNSNTSTSGDVKEDSEINDEHEEDGNVYKKCEICFKAFKTIRTYRNHQMEVHNDSKPIFTCEMCYCDFSRKYRLMNHIDKVHKDELHWIDENKKAKFNDEDCEVSCQHCDKVFISEQSMKYHNFRIHSKEIQTSRLNLSFICWSIFIFMIIYIWNSNFKF